MSINLIEQFKELASNAITDQVAQSLGGNKESVLSGLTSAGASVLGAAVGKASSDEGASSLFEMLGDGSTLNNIGDNLSEGSDLLNSGSNLVSSLLGEKASSVVDMISKDSGLNADESSNLLNIGGGLIGGLLGQQKALGGGLPGLTSLLGAQGSILDKLLPGLGGLLGLGSLAGLAGKLGSIGDGAMELAGDSVDAVTDVVGNVAGAAGDAVGNVADAAGDLAGGALDAGSAALSGGTSLIGKLLPWAVIAALGLGAFTLLKSCGSDVADTASSAANVAVDSAANVADVAVGTAQATVEVAADAAEGTANLAEGAVDAAADAVEGTANAAESVAENAAEAVDAFGKKVGELFSVELPGGVKLDVPQGGFEANLADALKGGLEPGKYYDFDRLFFATSSASLNADSLTQVKNTAAILNAYPDVKIQLRGHTDSSGNASSNNALSEKRAASVKNALVSNGIAADRIITAGKGSSEPAADNSTPEGMQRNRRIDISVVK